MGLETHRPRPDSDEWTGARPHHRDSDIIHLTHHRRYTMNLDLILLAIVVIPFAIAIYRIYA
jgi:hypothetical protein